MEWAEEKKELDWKEIKEKLLGEVLPNHMKYWWYCLGGIPALLFLTLVVTGIMLAFYYVPHPDKAFESVANITNNVRFGWWIRGIHRWSAELMVVTVSLHAIRVFVTNAYSSPRELCWVTGAVLLLLTLFTAFSGYSLVYSQQSYWAVVVGSGLAAKVPVVGDLVARFMLGGPTYGPNTLNRLYILHAALMPSILFLFIFIHIFLIRIHGVTEHLAGIQAEIIRGLSRDEE